MGKRSLSKNVSDYARRSRWSKEDFLPCVAVNFSFPKERPKEEALQLVALRGG